MFHPLASRSCLLEPPLEDAQIRTGAERQSRAASAAPATVNPTFAVNAFDAASVMVTEAVKDPVAAGTSTDHAGLMDSE